MSLSYGEGTELGGRGQAFPDLSWKSNKSALIFSRKGPNCVYTWFESSFQNVVLRVSRGKRSKLFPCKPFFLLFFDEKFIKVR